MNQPELFYNVQPADVAAFPWPKLSGLANSSESWGKGFRSFQDRPSSVQPFRKPWPVEKSKKFSFLTISKILKSRSFNYRTVNVCYIYQFGLPKGQNSCDLWWQVSSGKKCRFRQSIGSDQNLQTLFQIAQHEISHKCNVVFSGLGSSVAKLLDHLRIT